MNKPLAAFASLCFVALASHAEALPATCLPTPLPSAALLPNYSLDMTNVFGTVTATIWRQPCTDGSGEVAVLARLTPSADPQFVCGLILVQDGIQRDVKFATSTPASRRSAAPRLLQRQRSCSRTPWSRTMTNAGPLPWSTTAV